MSLRDGVLPVEAEDPSASTLPSELTVGEGDDDALILWFLSLSVTERLAVAQDFVDSLALLKHGLRS